MALDIRNGIVGPQQGDQCAQARVLRILERNFIGTFQFDTQRKIVAAFAPPPARYACMPGALCARHELNQLAIAPYQKMR